MQEALQARESLSKEGISTTVVNLPTIKPIDEDFLVNLAKKHKKILVCEEHQVVGGLFSAVSEVLIRKFPVKVERIGIEDVFGQSGSPQELIKFYGLSADSIAEKAKKFLRQ